MCSDGIEAKQSRLERGHPSNLAQFDPHYTEQPGPSAPPNHSATFGSYSDNPNNPFARPLPSILPRPEENRPPPNDHNNGLPMQQGPHHHSADFNGPPRIHAPHMNGSGPLRGPFESGNPGSGGALGNHETPVPRPLHENCDTVNVPEWLVKEGGELRLSSTASGNSVIRYWPSYMTLQGSQVR